jgi:hypothetical protein
MTNKTLISLFAVAALFVFGYFYILPRADIKAPLNNSMDIAVPLTKAPLTEPSIVKPNVAVNIESPVSFMVTPAALKTFDQFTPIERDRLRLDFEAMSEPERLFAVISAEDEAWKKENFFPDKKYIENTDEVTLERLSEKPRDKTAYNALIYKWWLRKDPRWKEHAQMAAYAGSSFAARLLLHDELNTLGKRPDIDEAFNLQTIIILSGDDASHRFLMQSPGIFTRFDGDNALYALNSCLFTMNAAQKLDQRRGVPVYTRRPRPRVPWIKAY